MSIYLSNLSASPADDRDYPFVPVITNLASRVDLRQYAGGIEDQGRIGSCTCNATVSACEILLDRAGKPRDLSRLFLYYIIREYEGRIGKEGAFTRDALNLGRKIGIPPESLWPYNIEKENDRPSNEAYANTALINRYERISFIKEGDISPNWVSIKQALAEGMPVVFAMPVSNDFLTIQGPLAEQQYKRVGTMGTTNIGNHAMCIVGYDDALDGFIVENSWGSGWGDRGYWKLNYFTAGTQIFEAWAVRGFDGCEVQRFSDEQVKAAILYGVSQGWSLQQYVDAAVEQGVSFQQLARCFGVSEQDGREAIKGLSYPEWWYK